MSQTNACWILIAGPTGAGKTTEAKKIAASAGGIVFSIDEWMTNLFWMDLPEKMDLEWAMNRVARCEAQIAAVAEQLAATGVSAVLDLGFTQREQRSTWLARAQSAGIHAELKVVDAEVGERWQRVQRRNEGGTNFKFEVTRPMFDMMEARWEQPDASEVAAFAGK